MNPERLRWGDSRLDDKFETITAALGELHSSLRELREDLETYVEGQRRDREADRKEREKLREAQRLERKSDRRWIVGAVFTAAGLIIAAVSLLAGGIG